MRLSPRALARRLGLDADRALVASPARASDVYVVEYPKSGITWLTTMIAHMALIESGREDLDVTFANLRLIIPDIHLGREIGPPIHSAPPFRFIKSHAGFNPHYGLTIYLVRHPVSVAASHFRYLTARGQTDLDFGTFLRDGTHGIHNWAAHVLSWVSPRPGGGIMHLLRYEDLLTDPARELGELCGNLGWRVSPETIGTAVERASVAHMQASEAQFTARDPRFKGGFVKGQAVEVMDKDRAFIRETCAPAMDALGYGAEP